jgi:uncharacterized membrane protein YqjE
VSRQVGDVDLAVDPKEPDRSTGELVSSVAGRIGELVRKELELAKVEMSEEVKKGAKASSLLVAGGLLGYLALLLVSVAAALWLDEVMHPAVAFAIVAAVHAVIAAILAVVGRKRLSQVNPKPEQTIESVKEDVEWARTQKS